MKHTLVRSFVALVVSAVVLLGLGASAAFADTKVHEGAAVSIDVPDDWKAEGDENMLVVTTPDEAVGVMLAVIGAEDLEAALDALDTEIGKFVADLELGEAKQEKLNGMNAITIEGKGKVDGTDALLGVAVVESPSGKVVLLLVMAKAEAAEKHGAAIGAVLESFKPVQ